MEEHHNRIYELIKNWNVKGEQPFEFSQSDFKTYCNSINDGVVLIYLQILGRIVKTIRKQTMKRVLNYLFDIGLGYISMESLINEMREIDIENGNIIVTEKVMHIKQFHIVVKEWFIEQLVEEEFVDIDEQRNVRISDNGIMELKKLNEEENLN